MKAILQLSEADIKKLVVESISFIEGGSKTYTEISMNEGVGRRDNLFKFGKYIGKDKMVIIRKDPEYCVWLVQNLDHNPFTDKQLAQLDVEYYRKYQVFPIKSSLTPKYARIKGKLVSQMSADELQYAYNNGNDEMKWLVRQEHHNRGWVKRHGGHGTASAPAFQSDDVGDEAWMNESRKKKTDFFEKHGIKKETLPGDNVPSIGFSKTEQKWYGWSHRAIYGFGVGSEVKKGDAGYDPVEGKWTAKTLDDAKKMAINFANAVSESRYYGYNRPHTIVYDGCCSDINIDEWNRRMRGRRRCSYERLKKLIKKEYPDIYNRIGLDFYNPWHEDTYVTPEYYILTQSAIEYFFKKV